MQKSLWISWLATCENKFSFDFKTLIFTWNISKYLLHFVCLGGWTNFTFFVFHFLHSLYTICPSDTWWIKLKLVMLSGVDSQTDLGFKGQVCLRNYTKLNELEKCMQRSSWISWLATRENKFSFDFKTLIFTWNISKCLLHFVCLGGWTNFNVFCFSFFA